MTGPLAPHLRDRDVALREERLELRLGVLTLRDARVDLRLDLLRVRREVLGAAVPQEGLDRFAQRVGALPALASRASARCAIAASARGTPLG